jgi:hypothetical protein
MVLVSRTDCGHSKCKMKCIGKFHNKEAKWFSRRRCEVNNEINAQNYCFYGLCPSSGILIGINATFSNWICFRSQVSGETYILEQ